MVGSPTELEADPQPVTARTELTSLVARDFRNLRAVDAQVPRDGVVLLGENGQGKTNFLEAIRYTTIFRSARGAHDTDLVRHGEDGFFVAAHARLNSERSVSVGFDRVTKQKKVVVDGVVAPRMSDAFGCIAAVLLSPSDVHLISGGPGERRRYLDVLLSLVDSRYLTVLQRYRGALMRRNAALRELQKAGGSSRDEQQVAVWEPLLAEAGVVLWQKRAEWCERAASELGRLCSLMGETGTTGLELVRSGAANELSAQRLLDSLAAHRSRDMRRGNTSVGPHRDELSITLNGRELRLFGSGGQQRTAALALRFLETFTVCEQQKRWPVLLLDDPFAELDARRADRILRLIEDSGHGQVILAVPREDDVPSEFTRLERWRVRNGEIVREAVQDG